MEIAYKIELPPVSFIAGDYQEFEYNVTDAITGAPVDLSGITSAQVALFRYGDNETPALVVNGSLVTHEETLTSFAVRLNSDDTQALSGLYIQQPIIIDNAGKVFRPGQGTVNIIPRVHEENY